MIRSKRIAVTIIANGEALVDAVTGQAGVEREILEIWAEQADDVIIRGYIDTDRIVDVHGECDCLTVLPIPVHHKLKVGEVFSVGFLDEAGGDAALELTVFYSETG